MGPISTLPRSPPRLRATDKLDQLIGLLPLPNARCAAQGCCRTVTASPQHVRHGCRPSLHHAPCHACIQNIARSLVDAFSPSSHNRNLGLLLRPTPCPVFRQHRPFCLFLSCALSRRYSAVPDLLFRFAVIGDRLTLLEAAGSIDICKMVHVST